MQAPLEVVFSNIDNSPAVETFVRKKLDKLEKFYQDITSCHIYIDKPHKHKGRSYEVRLEVRVPGTELAVRTHPNGKQDYSDVNIAIRDSFAAVEKQLAARKSKFGHQRHTALLGEEE